MEGGPSAAASPTFRDLRHLALPLYLPSFATAIGQSLVVSVLPLYVKSSLGADVATVGIVVGMQGIGSPLSGIPAGFVVDRLGERFGILLGAAVTCFSYAACAVIAIAFVPGSGIEAGSHAALGGAVSLLAMARFLTGIGLGTFQVARTGWVKEAVPKGLRGRANGLIGGCARLANVIGPAVGGAAASMAGGAATFLLQTVLGMAIVGLLLAVVPRHLRPQQQASGPSNGVASDGVKWSIGKESQEEAARLQEEAAEGGASASAASSAPARCVCPPWLCALVAVAPIGFIFSFMRAVRALSIPLKADAMDLGVSGAGYVTAASFAFDSVTFPAAGVLMDRYGRKTAGVPALTLMGAGFALLGWAESVNELVFASAILGVGNGLSAGLIMTIGQDAAPSKAAGRFLGLFKVCTDSALFIGPFSVGVLTATFSLDINCWAMSVVALASATWYALRHREPTPAGQPGRTTCANGGVGTSTSRTQRHKHNRLVEELEELQDQVVAEGEAAASASPASVKA